MDDDKIRIDLDAEFTRKELSDLVLDLRSNLILFRLRQSRHGFPDPGVEGFDLRGEDLLQEMSFPEPSEHSSGLGSPRWFVEWTEGLQKSVIIPFEVVFHEFIRIVEPIQSVHLLQPIRLDPELNRASDHS